MQSEARGRWTLVMRFSTLCFAVAAAAASSRPFGSLAFVGPQSATLPGFRQFRLAAGVNGDGGVNGDDSVNGAPVNGAKKQVNGDRGAADNGYNVYGSTSGFGDAYDEFFDDDDDDSTLTESYSLGGVPKPLNSGYSTNRQGMPFSRALVYSSARSKRRLERRVRRRMDFNRILNEERRRSLRLARSKGKGGPSLGEEEMREDGYGDMFRKRRNIATKAARGVLKFGRNMLFPSYAKQPGTLILVRHGESLWNANKTFTGWADPDLSPQGYREVEHAARLLLEGGYKIDVAFTSRLKRAIRSTWMLLQELNEVYLPVFKSWRLNERMYGALTGLSKTETAEKLGHELVQAWRGSLRSRPPPVKRSDRYWPGRDRRYSDLPSSRIPLTESLQDCMGRTAPLWEDKISYELRMGRNVLVVAHANTLRGLVKIIDGVGDDEIQDVAIPTGIPIIYKFDKNLNPIPPGSGSDEGEGGGGGGRSSSTTVQQMHMNALFLEKPGLLKEALKRETEWCDTVPGYNYTMGRHQRPMAPLERSLYKLEAERELGDWAGQFVDRSAAEREDDGNDGRGSFIIEDESKVWDEGLHNLEEGQQFDPDFPEFHQALAAEAEAKTRAEELVVNGDTAAATRANLIANNAATAAPCMTAVPAEALTPGIGNVPIRKDAVIVIIRHGKTEHNKLGLFTGWEDAPLAEEGVVEAKEAGRLLKLHGFEFDIVYTSWLSRAIETAWYVMDELDCLWLPIIKSWRLNERMYGDLTGLSKKMVAQRHGERQFKAWRRGFKVRPPKVSSFSINYPGNDLRYEKYVKDLRFSVSESIIRSIEHGRPELHKKLPKTESLKDCMDRTIPFFTHQIVPEAINEGKRVLISSSENAIRGLLMHLCDIPENEITGLEIPNGLPIIFDVKSKCVKLLDDGSGIDPLEKYNFGAAGTYLFKPCLNDDGSPDEECDISYMSNSLLSDEERKTLEYITGTTAKEPVKL